MQKKAPAGKWRRQGSLIAALLLAVAVALVLNFALKEYRRLSWSYGLPMWQPANPEAYTRQRLEGLMKPVPAGKRTFLLSNLWLKQPAEVESLLQESLLHLPEDPAWLEEFQAYATSAGKIPAADLAAHARKIDPGNGFWIMRETDSLLVPLHDRPPRTKAALHSDPRYQTSVALFQEASKAPRYENYLPARQAERLRLMGPAEDLAGIADRCLFVSFSHESSGGCFPSPNILEVRAAELAAAGDAEGLREWIATADRLTRRTLAMQSGHQSFLLRNRTASSLRQEADKLHLGAEVALMKRWEDAANAIKAEAGPPKEPVLRLRAPVLASPHSYFSSDVTAELDGFVGLTELEPGLRAEHALGDRFGALILAGAFTLGAFIALLEVQRKPLPARGVSQGLMPLLRAGDHAWLAGLGVVLPLAWYAAWTRLSPMSSRDFNIRLFEGYFYFARLLAVLLLVLCSLLQVARWRLKKRGGFIGLAPEALWPGWAMVVYAALLVPLCGMLGFWPNAKKHEFLIACFALGLPLFWLLWQFGALVLSPGATALRSVMLWRFAVPSFVFAGAILLAVMPVLKVEEKKYVALDRICGPDPEGYPRPVLAARWNRHLRERMLEEMR